jgi:hypothetical protein
MAEALVPPLGFISIDWAEARKEVKIDRQKLVRARNIQPKPKVGVKTYNY